MSLRMFHVEHSMGLTNGISVLLVFHVEQAHVISCIGGSPGKKDFIISPLLGVSLDEACFSLTNLK
jgi:hypothetical protein